MLRRRNLADEFTTGLTLNPVGAIHELPLRNDNANDALFNDSEQELKTSIDSDASTPLLDESSRQRLNSRIYLFYRLFQVI